MKILDNVWMLWSKKEQCLIYRCGSTRKEVWDTVIEDEVLGTGVTLQDLHKRGFRAIPVSIITRDPSA